MPRNHAPGPSTLRNRNRVTNKTRLRVIKGNVEGDPLAFDEDEERARVVSTAGVDAEDANEHHLQAVLSAASVRHQQNVLRATRGADKPEKSEKPDAFIPIPDNTGLVDGWEEFYPVTRGAEPVSFIKTSATAEEAITDALTDGFTYYMDERDKEWLDKNNEDARGEGTSAQGSISTPSTRTSQRSAKAKGKEPDVAPPTPITEDEFELVMGVFERVTHEKTPFLHHGLTERSILPFSDYQDTFATPLQSSIFAVFVVPAWIPQPAQLSRIAKTIYPYWKERRIERGGHRIIPTLNYDEADVKNESYICFRRRDVKAMRKTRASQASSSEKLIRLQQELATVHELSMNLCKREELKRELLQYNQAVWEGREKFVDLKRKFPSLLSKDDEELLVDKERPPKRPKALEQKIKIPAKLPKDNAAHSAVGDEVPVKPKDKYRKIAKDIEDRYQAARERDLMWDDGLDNSYQAAPPLLGHRLYKFVQEQPEEERPGEPTYRAVRTRRGRGGVLRFDRRSTRSRPLRDEDFISSSRRSSESTDLGEDEAREQAWRLRTQWMHDVDDEPHVGPDGPDEQDRVLVDEWSLTTMRKTMRLITEQDSIALQSDPTLHWTLLDGTDKSETPFKIGAGFQSRREQHLAQQQAQQQAQQAQALRQQQQAKALAQQAASRQQGTPGPPQQGQLPAQQANGIPNTQASPPMSTTPIRRSSSAMGMPVRISSTGPMRPPATPTAPPIPATPTHASPPHPSGSPAHSDPPHLSTAPTSLPQDLPPSTGDSASSLSVPAILAKTTSHPSITMPNGFHMNGYNPLSNGVPLSSSQQVGMQQLSAYMNMNINSSRPAAYIGPNSVNYSVPAMNLKLPAARQIQWTASQAQGVPNPPPNVTIAHSRTQAALVNGGHASPPRTSQSPSIQHQQVVGSTSGY